MSFLPSVCLPRPVSLLLLPSRTATPTTRAPPPLHTDHESPRERGSESQRQRGTEREAIAIIAIASHRRTASGRTPPESSLRRIPPHAHAQASTQSGPSPAPAPARPSQQVRLLAPSSAALSLSPCFARATSLLLRPTVLVPSPTPVALAAAAPCLDHGLPCLWALGCARARFLSALRCNRESCPCVASPGRSAVVRASGRKFWRGGVACITLDARGRVWNGGARFGRWSISPRRASRGAACRRGSVSATTHRVAPCAAGCNWCNLTYWRAIGNCN